MGTNHFDKKSSPAEYRLAERKLLLDDGWDVIVAGGGPAGCAAAAAAAREGARTLLLEATGMLGGMGTAGLVPWLAVCSDKQRLVLHGLARHVRQALYDGMPLLQAEIDAQPFASVPIDPELLKRIFDDMVLDAGVQVRFHSALSAVEKRPDGAVDALIVADKSGLRACRAAVYIDCTGDGDLAAWAGAPFEKGDAGGKLQPASHCFVLANVDEPVLACEQSVQHQSLKRNPDSPSWKALRSDKYPLIVDAHCCVRKIGPGIFGFNAGHLYDVDNTDPDSVSAALVTGRRLALQVRDAFAEYHPAFRNAFLAATGSLLGIRETRRIIGEYVLTLEDYNVLRTFPDDIVRNPRHIDVHAHKNLAKAERANATLEDYQKLAADRPFRRALNPGESSGVPYRCMIPLNLTNVLVAGRCVSTDRWVNGCLRVMPICLGTGEVAGIAAAMSAGNGGEVRSIDVPELQRRIRKNGGYLPVPEDAPDG